MLFSFNENTSDSCIRVDIKDKKEKKKKKEKKEKNIKH